MDKHNIIVVSLSTGIHKTASVARTASNLLSLPYIRVGSLIGISDPISLPNADFGMIDLGFIIVD